MRLSRRVQQRKSVNDDISGRLFLAAFLLHEIISHVTRRGSHSLAAETGHSVSGAGAIGVMSGRREIQLLLRAALPEINISVSYVVRAQA